MVSMIMNINSLVINIFCNMHVYTKIQKILILVGFFIIKLDIE